MKKYKNIRDKIESHEKMTPFICVLWLVFSSALVQLFWRAVYDCSQQLYFLIFHSPVVFLFFICIVFSFIFISKLWITNTKRVRRVRYSFYWVTWKWILCLMLAYLHHHAARALSLFSSSLSSISDFIFHTAQLEVRALDSRKKTLHTKYEIQKNAAAAAWKWKS